LSSADTVSKPRRWNQLSRSGTSPVAGNPLNSVQFK